MKYWFSADLHLGHKNILKYCDRPFDTIDEHDEYIINTWNEKVHYEDKAFILGDVALCNRTKAIELITQLNGDITFILGNHDHPLAMKELCRLGYRVSPLLNIKIPDPEMDDKKQYITLCHYPMMSWKYSNSGSWNLHGHHHGVEVAKGLHVKYKLTQLDVGVDCFGYAPIDYERVKEIFTKRFLSLT